MNTGQFLSMIEEILELEPNRLDGEEMLKTFRDWDSLAVLEYMAAVDSRFGVKQNVEEIAGCVTVNDLFRLLKHTVEQPPAT